MRPLSSFLPFFFLCVPLLRFIKKWWFLRQLNKECRNHAQEQDDEFFYRNGKYFIERSAFLKQISRKCVERFSFILWRRKKYNQKKMRKKMDEYNSIIDSCIDDKYVFETNPSPNKIFIRNTTAGEDIMGHCDLIQKLLSKYIFLWTIIWAIIAFFAGIFADNLINMLSLN